MVGSGLDRQVWLVKVGCGMVRFGLAGMARRGKEGLGGVRQVRRGMAWRGTVGFGAIW